MVAPGVSVEQRVEPLARVGCYVPGGRFPLPSSLLMTAIPARVAGVARDHRRLPAAGAGGDGGGARSRRHAAVPRRRRARDRRARVRHGDDSARRQDRRPGQPLRRRRQGARRRATARSISTPARPRSSSSPAADGRRGLPPTSIAQAEHDPDARAIFITWSRALADARRRAPSPAQAAGRAIVAAVARRATAPSIVTRDGGRGDGAREPHRAGASGRRSRVARAAAARRPARCSSARSRRRRRATTRPDRTTCCRPSGAARFRGGLSAADFVRVMSVQRVTRAGLARLAPTIVPLARAEGLEAHAESIEVRLS